MDIDGLNNKLMTLTDEELKYQQGQLSTDWESLWPKNGNDVYVNAVSDEAHSYLQAQQRQSRGGSPGPSSSLIWIQQNLRFNPVPEHIHSYVELCFVYSGTCPQTVNGKSMVLQENQVLLLDRDCPHSVGTLQRRDIMLSVMLLNRKFLQDEILASFAQESVLSRFLVNAFTDQTDHHRYILFNSQRSHRVRVFFQELCCEFFDPSTNSDIITRALLKLLFAELINVYEADCTRAERESKSVPVIPIIHYIERNYLTCTQESVARHFSISPRYVSSLLKRHTGMTYLQVVQAQKLGRAASMLRNGNVPVVDIARDCGYQNITFFYRKFEEWYGCSPGEYRSRHYM